jgi:hypothetical protein
MRWLMAVNVAGIVAGASYAGLVVSPRWTPLLAVAGTVLFLVSLVVPFALEYRSVGRGFHAVESSFLDKVRRPHFPGPRVEVFQDAEPAPVFRRRRTPVKALAALTVLAGLLFGADVAIFLATPPPPGETAGKITNF